MDLKNINDKFGSISISNAKCYFTFYNAKQQYIPRSVNIDYILGNYRLIFEKGLSHQYREKISQAP